MSRHYQRREFLKLAGAAAMARSLNGAEKPVRIGFVGVGNRGTGLVKILLDVPGVEIPAICDINEEHLKKRSGHRREERTQATRRIFARRRRLSAHGSARGSGRRHDCDSLGMHTPIAVAAMKAGKYAATEVPAAITVEQCWELVNTSEQTGMPCMMLENDCFGRGALMALNLVQQGVLGELIHCEGGYDHDIRAELLKGGDLSWRGLHALRRNANLYPTHPIGPIAWWTSINRGDRFTYLTSMSSRSRGLNRYAEKHFGPDNVNAKRQFGGDVNTSLIMTEKGITVTLNHDTQLPRPYSDSGDTKIPLMVQRLQGTEGIFFGSMEKIYIDGRSPLHKWEDTASYYEQYEHFLWRELGDAAKSSSHGGEDFVELHQFVWAVRNKIQTPVDVYDAATWSVIIPLSEQSVASKSATVDFPDFTRGKWKNPRPLNLGL